MTLEAVGPLTRAPRLLGHANLVGFAVHAATWSGGSAVVSGGLVACSVPAPVSLLNALLPLTPGLDAADVLAVGRARLGDGPWSVWWPEDEGREQRHDLLLAGGMEYLGRTPSMVRAQGTSRPADLGHTSSVSLRSVSSDADWEDFWEVAEAAYDGTGYAGPLRALFPGVRLPAAPPVHAVVAYDGDRPVGCALAVRSGQVAGVHWVGVLPGHQRSGVGLAVTEQVARAAAAAGAPTAVLQSSEMGFNVYERLGFRTSYCYDTYTCGA